jgi:hypothetical protein
MRYAVFCRLVLFSVLPLLAAGGDRSPAPPEAEAFLRELLELRLEVYTQGIELADWKIRHFEDRLEHNRAERRTVDEEERAIVQDLTSPDNESGEVGSRKAELSSGELPRLYERKRALEQQLAESSSQLVRERERRSRLVRLAGEVAARLQAMPR